MECIICNTWWLALDCTDRAILSGYNVHAMFFRPVVS